MASCRIILQDEGDVVNIRTEGDLGNPFRDSDSLTMAQAMTWRAMEFLSRLAHEHGEDVDEWAEDEG